MVATILIDGRSYELPTLEDVTLDEAIMLERYAGATLSELEQREGDISLGALKGLAVIGVMRARPDATEREIQKAIGQIKISKLQDAFDFATTTDEAGEPLPPTSAEGESSGSTDSPAPSGETSGESGEGSSPGETGQNASGTSALEPDATSVRRISAA